MARLTISATRKMREAARTVAALKAVRTREFVDPTLANGWREIVD
jgi:hypothetical protein